MIGCGVLPLLNTAVLLAFVPAAAWERHTWVLTWAYMWLVRTLRGEHTPSPCRWRQASLVSRDLRDEEAREEGETARRGAARGEAAMDQAMDQAALLDPSPLDPEAAEQGRAGSDALLLPPPPPPPPPWWRWQQRWQAQLQLLRRVAAAAWSVGALWLMLTN